MIRSLFACSLFLAIAACGGSSSPSATTSTTPTAAVDDRCPMAIDGTSVSALDTPTGGTLAFRTTGDAAALRTRVAGWAERHTARHAAMGPLPTGAETAPAGGDHAHHHHDHGGAPAGGGEAAAPVDADPATMVDAHSSATATDVDGGVDLTFVTFPDQLAGLQAELRSHAEHLAASGCGAP